jgi:hypothetical protein
MEVSQMTSARRMRSVRIPQAAAVWVLAAVLWAFFAAAAAPSPIFLVYRDEWGFPVWMLTLAFAIYAIALLGALLTLGRLSDHVGRRPVLVGALLLECLAMTLFLTAGGIWTVILARVVQGVATGAATSALSAGIADTASVERSRLAALLSSVAPLSGLAVGAVFSGIAADAGDPVQLVFIAFLVLFLLALSAVLFSRESVSPRRGGLRSLAPKVAVPPTARAAFFREIPVSVAVWVVGGFYLAVMGEVLRESLGVRSGAVEGAFIAGVSACGAIASLIARNVAPRRNAAFGSALIACGMPIVLFGMDRGSLTVIGMGTVCSGFGFGLGYLGGVGLLAPLAAAHERSELFSALYIVNYLAFGIPAVIAGILIGTIGLLPTVNGYGSVVIIAGCIGAVLQFTDLGSRSARSSERSK